MTKHYTCASVVRCFCGLLGSTARYRDLVWTWREREQAERNARRAIDWQHDRLRDIEARAQDSASIAEDFNTVRREFLSDVAAAFGVPPHLLRPR